MYRITIAVIDNPTVIDTDVRKLARYIYELGVECPKQLEVTVEVIAKPKPVKFKGLPEQGKAAAAVPPEPGPEKPETKPAKQKGK